MKRVISRLLCLGTALFIALAVGQVSAAVPTITTQPVGGAVPCGSNFTLSVTAASLPPLAYQWWQNLAPLADATNASFSLIASAATAGDYTVVVSNTDGSVTSVVATVTIVDTNPPQITCPADIIAAEFPHDGGSAVVTFAAPVTSDICDSSLAVACVPPSGTAFAVGYTSVTCDARDDSGNSNQCAFVIRVIPYRLPVTTTADGGPGSLRQALLDANDAPGENLIEFQLPGAGPFVISPASPLPVVTSPVILDGWSQAGFSGTPAIELNGAGAPGADGLVIHSASNVVRGLAMHGFATAIRLESGASSVIQSNYLGTDATGTNAPGNVVDGLFIGSPANVVQGNLISGNGNAGLQIAGGGAISNIIQGNLIGVAADGLLPLGNVLDGVLIGSNAARNLIGGTSGAAANVIAFNRRNGIGLNSDAGAGNTLQGNSILSNELLGIDLALDGPTSNDATDADTGPNGLQNFPILADARSIDGVTTIDGSLDSVSDAEYRLDFYLNDAADPSGFGEGAVHIGSTTVILRNGGSQDFSVSLPVTATFVQFVTATATDPAGSTSEFSPPVQVRTPPVLETQPAGTNAQLGQPVTLCVTASGTPPLAYQWRLNGQNIPGATDRCFTIPSTESTNGGAYSVVVVNVLGARQTIQAPLTVPLTNLAAGDNFADRVLIEGTNGLIVWRNRFASREPDEPNHAGKPGGKSV
ncbi:MAG TPA: immunoglobulin domain-containing protein, partial [Verrucomicrobiae bacterium]|nr:immunoglobulin domain-containing protein [Verrucomicrobiae bacterium]